jgi:methyl acetate hydrolase
MPERRTPAHEMADRTLARAVEHADVPGVVALAADKHDVVYQGAFGLRAFDQSAVMTLDTVFAIASMTKAVTAVAAMQLVEQGRLSLDQAVGDQLPEIRAAQVLDGFDANGAPRLRSPRQPITLRHLLTHTAGFGYTTWNAALHRFEQGASEPVGLFRGPLVFDPGDRWEYGTSIDWVGRLIEHVTDQSLEEYFRVNIFDPLEMLDTGFVLRGDQRVRLASRYERQADGSLRYIPVEIPARPATFSGGGGLYSTGSDYIRFLRMLLASGQFGTQRVLRPESVAQLTCNQIGDLQVGVLRSTRADLSNDVEFFPGTIKKWSLAGLINTVPTRSGRSAGSWAWGGLFNTYFWVDPTRGVSGLILTQLLPFCDAPVLALFERFESDIYASLGYAPLDNDEHL